MSFSFQSVGSGHRLGQWFGIPISIHWSWVPIALLLTLSFLPFFSVYTFGLVWSLAAVLGLFASVLLHEFGHALTARRFGINTQEITLHCLGGVAKIESEPKTARAEFWIAAAGPAVSFALSALFWLLMPIMGFLSAPSGAVLAFLAISNLALAIFNLLPGLPLDGGRILRAVHWGRTGNRHRATAVAARGGEFIGYALIALGILGALGVIGFGGLFTALIGWFILSQGKRLRREAEAAEAGFRPLDLGLFGQAILGAYRRAQNKRPTSGPKPPPSGDEEVIRFPDGREVIVPRRKSS